MDRPPATPLVWDEYGHSVSFWVFGTLYSLGTEGQDDPFTYFVPLVPATVVLVGGVLMYSQPLRFKSCTKRFCEKFNGFFLYTLS